MKRADRLQTPGLPFRSFRLRPHDGLPVGIEDQISAGADLETVASGLVAVEEERLPDRVLVRARFNRYVSIAEDVGGPQHVFTAVHHVRQMMKAAGGTA